MKIYLKYFFITFITSLSIISLFFCFLYLLLKISLFIVKCRFPISIIILIMYILIYIYLCLLSGLFTSSNWNIFLFNKVNVCKITNLKFSSLFLNQFHSLVHLLKTHYNILSLFYHLIYINTLVKVTKFKSKVFHKISFENYLCLFIY